MIQNTPATAANPRQSFLENRVSRPLIVVNALLALCYFMAIVFFFERGNQLLFWILLAGEVFHIWQIMTFLYTIWDTEYVAPHDLAFSPPVDVFITVAGEPVEIVAETVKAAQAMDYPAFSIYLLNDGYVAGKDNWREIESLASELGVHCITRTVPGGAKAGNINNALRQTTGPFVAVFDTDHVPHRDFLTKMMSYFFDEKVGFAQSPQYYRKHDLNLVTAAAWEQQALFFGAISKGKNRLGAVTMAGTNMILRRTALERVGGMCEESIAEDFLTGLFIHELGYTSVYHPEVLAEGLAPEDFLSYYKQQFRWARGSLDMLFRYNLIFRSGLTLPQKIQYLSSVSFFVSGVVVLLNALIPLLYLFTGVAPFTSSTMSIAFIFLPYIFVTLYVLERASNFSFTYRSLAFAMAGFTIHLKSLATAFLGLKSSFSVTSKTAVRGNFTSLVIPHLVYFGLMIAGVAVGFWREGISPSLVTNLAWVGINAAIFGQFIVAALPVKSAESVVLSTAENEREQVLPSSRGARVIPIQVQN
jgi:cellulose synthase (UDP-forming)